ncbi:MAG: hypothetical protein JO069_18455 [Verrucomicrobia bacterium]|nr:hypothetical protein [Verrucomicrobiota bacterium]
MAMPHSTGRARENAGSSSSRANDLPPAPRGARLELVTEGLSHFCIDGTVIGSKGNLPASIARRWSELESRHLLLGMEGDAWFAFTPLNVVRPFSLDGEPLPLGKRRPLDRVRHHLAFDHVRIGLRLHPAETRLPARLRRLLGRRQS